jgi:hypothetical protein
MRNLRLYFSIYTGAYVFQRGRRARRSLRLNRLVLVGFDQIAQSRAVIEPCPSNSMPFPAERARAITHTAIALPTEAAASTLIVGFCGMTTLDSDRWPCLGKATFTV